MNIASNQPNEGTEDDDTKQSDITLGDVGKAQSEKDLPEAIERHGLPEGSTWDDVGRAQSEEGLSGVRERYKDRL